MKYIAYLILLGTIIFNVWLYYPETQILADPNDNIFQFSLVGRTNWIWENYGCPLSLSCIPNLIDHNVSNWAEGYPLPFYYSHVPQITIVSSYNLIIKPLLSFISHPLSLYQYYNWTKYLLLTFFPLSVFLALRIVGFSPILAAFGAFFSVHFSTDGLYGIDSPSYLWRGYGLTSQLYAIVFIPLAIAFTYRAMRKISNIKDQISKTKVKNHDIFWAILFLTLTTAGHLGIGIIGFISTIPFLFFDLAPRIIWLKFKKLFLILTSCFLILSYWIIPILIYNKYHIISFWDPIWKFNSYGVYEVLRQFLGGEIFDWQRFPIITAFVLTGFFVMSLRKKYIPFALLFVFWMLLYFGRTTWGGLIDLIPGMKDFHQSRFVVGVHIAALFLIPAGLQYIFDLIKRLVSFTLQAANSKFKIPASPAGRQNSKFETNINILFYILLFIFTFLLTSFTAKQTVDYAQLNNKWIYQANDAYRYDEGNFKKLLAKVDSQPKGRIYAGRPGNWGKDFRLGSTQLYLLLGGIGYDYSQFLPETWSPMSENEQNFDERESLDYDLLNIKYVISPKNESLPPSVKFADKFGPFELYKAPSTGWFDIVTAPMYVKSDKTNYINLVHLWWNSYPRRWKMHPLISVEGNPIIPDGMQKILEMKDEVSYTEGDKDTPGVAGIQGFPRGGGTKNIFSDYPFVFPEATVSGKIKEEKVEKQTYSATVDVPNNCKSCFAMFKMSYHPDWRVKVDGNDASTFAVFPFYLAASVSPGTHTVEFTYQPNRLKIILLAGEIIAVIIILVILQKKKLKNKFGLDVE